MCVQSLRPPGRRRSGQQGTSCFTSNRHRRRSVQPQVRRALPELVRTLHRELAEMDARFGALQRSRGALAAYLG
jgi:hypothetical protein